MDVRELIYRLLHLALLEIRIDASEGGGKKSFHLADLFHNVPLQLQRVAEGEGSYEEIVGWLRERAREKGCERWLEKAIDEVSPRTLPSEAGVRG